MYIISKGCHKQGFYFKNWYFLRLTLKPITNVDEVHQEAVGVSQDHVNKQWASQNSLQKTKVFDMSSSLKSKASLRR